MLNAILIDDEAANLQNLTADLVAHCPDVAIIAAHTDPHKGLEAVRTLQPDILFLDVEMPAISGFDLLELLMPAHFSVIFVTAHDHYALRAFQYAATDYLLKPVPATRLIEAVERARHQKQQNTQGRDIELLLQSIRVTTQRLPNIPIPTFEGYEFVPVSDIVYLEADGNYTNLFLKCNRKHTISRTLKDFEALLGGHPFLRTHQSYLVHIPYIARYCKGTAGYLMLTTGQKIEISRAMKPRVMEALIK